MIPVAIFSFLVGAVLSWAFRVWILVPVSFLVLLLAFVVEDAHGASLMEVFGYGLLTATTPQLGYMFGLFAHAILPQSSLHPSSSRPRLAAILYKMSATRRPH